MAERQAATTRCLEQAELFEMENVDIEGKPAKKSRTTFGLEKTKVTNSLAFVSQKFTNLMAKIEAEYEAVCERLETLNNGPNLIDSFLEIKQELEQKKTASITFLNVVSILYGFSHR